MMFLPIVELMKIWGDLVEAYYDKTIYRGNTTEIYSYRLEQYCPSVHKRTITQVDERTLEIFTNAALTLKDILEEFIKKYECKVVVNGWSFKTWKKTVMENNQLLAERYEVAIIKEKK
jgi:hypothetical protein